VGTGAADVGNSYFGDESGVLLFHYNREYDEGFPPVNKLPYEAADLAACLYQYRQEVLDVPRDSFPKDLHSRFSARSGCEPPHGLSGNTIYSPRDTGFYKFIYSPKFDPQGKVTGYSIVAVPDHYGIPNEARPKEERVEVHTEIDDLQPMVRSYYIDETLVVRATAENRLPTASDAEVSPCELDGLPLARMVSHGCNPEWIERWAKSPK
jgi:hypothetical protein